MKIFRSVRMPLLALVLLATLLMTGSAFAASPVAKETKIQKPLFSSYMEHSGEGCMYSQMSAWDD